MRCVACQRKKVPFVFELNEEELCLYCQDSKQTCELGFLKEVAERQEFLVKEKPNSISRKKLVFCEMTHFFDDAYGSYTCRPCNKLAKYKYLQNGKWLYTCRYHNPHFIDESYSNLHVKSYLFA